MADAFVWSLMWSDPPAAPPDRVQAIQLSTVPMQTSRPVRSPLLASSQATFVTDWFGAIVHPCSALAVRHSPMVRRSCQPSPLPIGSPVVRSHSSVEARWLVMPTAVIGSPTRSITVPAASSSLARHVGGVELDETAER